MGPEMPADKQAAFQHTYTTLMAFLAAILPPVITEGVEDHDPEPHEVALSKCSVAAQLSCELLLLLLLLLWRLWNSTACHPEHATWCRVLPNSQVAA